MLAVADSDSYLKWAAGLLNALPASWITELTVVRTPITPSDGQIEAAVSGTRSAPAPVLSARRLRRSAERFRPDVVLLACTGPVVDALAAEILSDLRPRPVFVSGLPGISVPATEKAWLYRSGCDLFVVHSGREVAEFSAIGRELGGGGGVALARLPYLDLSAPAPQGGPARRDRVVFATQAKVPRRREEREEVLLALAALAVARPDLDVVVKLRARESERQTHNERHHYETLWTEMAEEGRLPQDVPRDAVSFAAGAMHEHLTHAAGFVTVSSTAALEAIARRVPLLVLSDFGVSAEMINLVFEGSGCLGTMEDLAKAGFRMPTEEWCRANYFHDASASDWIARISALVEDARAGRHVPARSVLDGPEHATARRRARLRLEVPPKVLRYGYRAKRRMRRYLKTF
ncbi:hypothetical protein N5079_24465 [Planotetraspora sp. A-T 1434]|uniref:DUF6716 putative glycosyltransferase n=1 Tax=Planotetraspora sp. A-T 1434 TaxID=2979219 RepID=UPI0021BF33F1|nr:DUF6716 putative glycosyltransferase [Planotetraspora sp. A-T 1434]MCT9933372.1 hypothetical protein [Planotetraspora sp. A-T 1434]